MPNENEKQVPIHVLFFRLRALVSALGETVQPAWWRTSFMSEIGMRFLERLYPRTSFHAAVHATGKAACDVHDKAAGRLGVYHLFRLPEALEAEMNRIPSNIEGEFIAAFRAALGHQDKLMDLLSSLCNGASSADAATGAKRIGTENDLMTASGFDKTAAVYRNAFTRGKPVFPYFASEQSGARE